jgi:hypothetical protein
MQRCIFVNKRRFRISLSSITCPGSLGMISALRHPFIENEAKLEQNVHIKK